MKKIFFMAIGSIGAYFINTQLIGVSPDIAAGITIGFISGTICYKATEQGEKHD